MVGLRFRFRLAMVLLLISHFDWDFLH